ncbi:MAG: hypothetical protein M0C28_48710 [Candidatus Moduliflexus flocculans]|nr:hypothetical protein [Candidatus Moduliflexus flocculans]
MTERSCLACHAKQGYEEGDIRGGISVTFPVDRLEGELKKNVALVFGLEILIAAGTLAAVIGFVIRLRRQLDLVRAELEQAATRDALTELYNRRYILERFAQEEAKCRRSGQPWPAPSSTRTTSRPSTTGFGHAAGDAAPASSSRRTWKSGVRGVRHPRTVRRRGVHHPVPGHPSPGGAARLRPDPRGHRGAPRPRVLEAARITVSMGVSDTVCSGGAGDGTGRPGFRCSPGRTKPCTGPSRGQEPLRDSPRTSPGARTGNRDLAGV